MNGEVTAKSQLGQGSVFEWWVLVSTWSIWCKFSNRFLYRTLRLNRCPRQLSQDILDSPLIARRLRSQVNEDQEARDTEEKKERGKKPDKHAPLTKQSSGISVHSYFAKPYQLSSDSDSGKSSANLSPINQTRRSPLKNSLPAIIQQDGSTKEIRTEVLRNRTVRLLLVEDNKSNQNIIKTMLQMLHFEVLTDSYVLFSRAHLLPTQTDTADDGLEALEKVSQNNYDMILMDFQMPRMDGLTAARKIREKGPSLFHISSSIASSFSFSFHF